MLHFRTIVIKMVFKIEMKFIITSHFLSKNFIFISDNYKKRKSDKNLFPFYKLHCLHNRYETVEHQRILIHKN